MQIPASNVTLVESNKEKEKSRYIDHSKGKIESDKIKIIRNSIEILSQVMQHATSVEDLQGKI